MKIVSINGNYLKGRSFNLNFTTKELIIKLLSDNFQGFREYKNFPLNEWTYRIICNSLEFLKLNGKYDFEEVLGKILWECPFCGETLKRGMIDWFLHRGNGYKRMIDYECPKCDYGYWKPWDFTPRKPVRVYVIKEGK